MMNMFMWLAAYSVIVGLFLTVVLCGPTQQSGILARAYSCLIHIPVYIGNALCCLCCCGMTRGKKAYRRTEEYVCYSRNPIMQILYVFLIGGAVFVFFWQVYPMIPKGAIHRFGAPLATLATGICYILACLVDSGVVTEENVSRHMQTFPYDDILYHKDRNCKTCKFNKPPRSKHCSLCKGCVAKQDHHCPWLNQCVGAGNYLYFMLFLISHSMLCAYGAFICLRILGAHMMEPGLLEAVARHSNGAMEFAMLILQIAVFRYTWVVAEFIFLVAISLVLLGFYLYHSYLICINNTTNESFKWSDLKREYKHHGRLDEFKTLKNIYNRGVIANWMEVIFPLHLRSQPGPKKERPQVKPKDKKRAK